MSDTPRTDKVNTEIQGGRALPIWVIEATIIDHARTLERELAAMTAAKELAERERDALKEIDAVAKNLEWCMRLSKSAREGETMVQWVKRMIGETARAELAERQVEVLSKLASERACIVCPAYESCKITLEANPQSKCYENMDAWSRAEAAKGVQG